MSDVPMTDPSTLADDSPPNLSALVVRDNTTHTNETRLIVPGITNNQNARQPSTAIITYDEEIQGLLQEVENVKRNRIAESTRDQYTAANVTFMKFIFKHFPSVLKHEILELYQASNESNTPRDFSKDVKESLGGNNKLPIDLNLLTSDMFMTYLVSLKRPNGDYYSVSYYETKKSAFLNLITESGNVWDDDKLREIAFVMVSLKKTIAKYNSDNGIQPTEGKEHMSWACFRLTCQLFIEDGSPASMFGLFFILMQWSLIARSESVEKISLDQLTWVSDHLKVYYPKHKGDQIGLTKDEPRHVYSNPIKPEVCPIRAMASYFLTFPQILQDGKDLFPGESQHTRFHDILLKLIHNNEDEYFQIGVSAQDIGTHSVRKGAATYCCAGVHPGPPVISVCLRAGWSVGRVKERYLKYENAGDELVGRTLTGIPPTSCNFGISPVYFKSNDLTEEDIEVMVATSFPLAQESLIGLTYVLTSSFIYHEEWTVANTRDVDSPLLHSPYFSINSAYPGRKDLVETALPWEDKPNAPSLTGIPIHCSLLNKLVELTEIQKALPEQMLEKFIAELDQRNIGGSLNAQRILDGIKQSNDELKNLLTSRFVSHMNQSQDDPTAIIQATMLNTGPPAQMPATSITRDIPLLSSEDGIWGHYWNNKVCVLPETFRFPPKKSLLSLWLSWHVPDVSRKVCPYRILQCSDVQHLVRGPNKLRDMKLVIEMIVTNIKKHDDWYNKYLRGYRNVHQLSQVFDAFKCVFLNILSDKRKPRFGQLSWETFVRDARKLKNNLVENNFVPPPCTQYPSEPNSVTPPVTQQGNTTETSDTSRNNDTVNMTLENSPNSTATHTSNRTCTNATPNATSTSTPNNTTNSSNPPSVTQDDDISIAGLSQPTHALLKQSLSDRKRPSQLQAQTRAQTRLSAEKARKKALLNQRTLLQRSRTAKRNNKPPVARRYRRRPYKPRKTKTSKPMKRNITSPSKEKPSLKTTTTTTTTTTDAFDAAFQLNETALIRPSKHELELDDFGRFKSVICRKCNQFPTSHRCSFEIANGFKHEGKNICALPICALCSAEMGIEGGPFRCESHVNKESTIDL